MIVLFNQKQGLAFTVPLAVLDFVLALQGTLHCRSCLVSVIAVA